MTAATRELTLIVAGDPGQRTGGYLYDARIAAALRDKGWRVRELGLAGSYPLADPRARRALDTALGRLPEGQRVVIDGLAMGGLPEVVEAHAGRLAIAALVHHPLADETGLDADQRRHLWHSEARALAAVRQVIVTSGFTARRLADLGVPASRVQVVEPGVDAMPPASAGVSVDDARRSQRLLCVASLTPRKGHEVLLEALAGMRGRAWHCECAGSPDRDAAHALRVRATAEDYGLASRVDWLGELDDAALSAAYQRANVLVVPSHYEGYGMAVTEALARGLPVISTDGGALADTVPAEAGLTVPAGDAQALRRALQRWCDEPALRRRLCRGARQARTRLGDWSAAADVFASILEQVPEKAGEVS